MLRFVFGLILCNFVLSSKLPPTFKTCKRSQSDFSECLRREIESAVSQITRPFPKVGLQSFEPLEVDSMTIGEGTGTVNVVQHFKNIKVYGLSKIQIESVKYDFDKNILTTNALAKEIRQIADYEFNGRVLLLPIVGKGKSTLVLDNVRLVHTTYFDKIQKDGKTHIIPSSAEVTMNPSKVTFDFENLFNGDKQLSDNILKVLNENWKEVYTDVQKGYEKAYGEIVFAQAKNFFYKVPFDDIFPE